MDPVLEDGLGRAAGERHERIHVDLVRRVLREVVEQVTTAEARQEATAREVLVRLRQQPGVVLADEVGMGKTFVALAVAACAVWADAGGGTSRCGSWTRISGLGFMQSSRGGRPG